MANGADILSPYGEAAKTAVGFFWKSGRAFVLGYWVSAMMQASVPKGRLTPYLGSPAPTSITLSSLFGAISSSCSFAALATVRSLLFKGAHFVSAVAFMFASTNLVIELGILILSESYWLSQKNSSSAGSSFWRRSSGESFYYRIFQIDQMFFVHY